MRRAVSTSFSLVLGAAMLAEAGTARAAGDADGDARGEPPVAVAVISGALTAFIPLALGGVRVVTAPPSDLGARNVGYAVAGVGPALSPIIAHAVLGEWGRAAAFSAPSIAAEIGMCTLFAVNPAAAFDGTTMSRSAFGVLFTADILGGAVGLVDAMMAHERWAARRKGVASDPFLGLSVAPRVGAGQLGIAIGGAL